MTIKYFVEGRRADLTPYWANSHQEGVMKSLLIAVALLGFSGTASASFPLVNGIISSSGGNLCMEVSGSGASGSRLVADDCVTGKPAQQFTVDTNGAIYFGQPGSSLCVIGQTQSGVFSSGTPVVLASCSTTNVILNRVDINAFKQAAGVLAFMDNSAHNYCISTTSTSPGQPLALNLCVSGAAGSQYWNSVIARRLLSKNLSTVALFNSQGCLLDNMMQPITALTCGLAAISGPTASSPLGTAVAAGSTQTKISNLILTIQGNGDPIKTSPVVAAGGGNVVAAGGGNVVAAGGGNVVAAGGGNVVAAGGGNVVAAGGGNLVFIDKNGNPIQDVIVDQKGNIIAAGGGNIIAAGGGNVVSTAGGNLTLTLSSTNGTFSHGVGDTSPLTNTANAINMALLTISSSPYKSSSPTTSPTGGSAYQVTSVSSDAATWAPASTHTITWQGTGTPASGQTVTVYLQPNSGSATTLCANVAASAGRCTATAPGTATTGTLDAVDSVSHKNVYATSPTQVAAASSFTISAIAIDSKVATAGTALTWATASPHLIQWQASGTATSQETVSLWLQQGSNMIRLASSIPASQLYYNLPANSASAGTTGIFVLKDDLTNKQISGPTITVSATAPTTAPTTAAAYQVTAVSADASPWAPGSVHTIAWQGTGTPASGQTVTVYFVPNSGAALTLCANVAPTAGRCSAYAPSTPTTGTLDVVDSVSRKNVYAASQTQVVAAQAFSISAVAIDSKVATAGTALAWAVASPHLIQWQATGTATSQETVSLWLAQGSNMIRLASAIPAGQLYYNLPANSARSGTTGVFILKDDLTNRQITGPTITVR